MEKEGSSAVVQPRSLDGLAALAAEAEAEALDAIGGPGRYAGGGCGDAAAEPCHRPRGRRSAEDSGSPPRGHGRVVVGSSCY